MSDTDIRLEHERRARRRRSDGERSRNVILYEAGQLATVEGSYTAQYLRQVLAEGRTHAYAAGR